MLSISMERAGPLNEPAIGVPTSWGSIAAPPAAPPSPPQRRNHISLLSPDNVGLGAVLAAVTRVDLDAHDERLIDDEGVGGMSLSVEPSIVYTDQTIDEANTACFLLQKTPTLDVLFLERTKVMPTLYVIIIRHPMASNSWGATSDGFDVVKCMDSCI